MRFLFRWARQGLVIEGAVCKSAVASSRPLRSVHDLLKAFEREKVAVKIVLAQSHLFQKHFFLVAGMLDSVRKVAWRRDKPHTAWQDREKIPAR